MLLIDLITDTSLYVTGGNFSTYDFITNKTCFSILINKKKNKAQIDKKYNCF